MLCYSACHGGKYCCTKANQCGVGEGNCGKDEDCKKGLVCGRDNCNGETYDKHDNCCEKPGNHISLILL